MNDKKFFYVLLIASVALALVFAVLIFGKGGAQPTGQDEVYQYASLANEHYSNEEWNKAIEYYDKVVEAKRASSGIWKNRGYAFLRLAHEEQYNNDADASVTDEFAEEAIRSLETAVERDPQDHESLFYLGYIHLFMRDNWERAAPYLERAYDLDPKDPEYLIGMGWVHSQNAEESLEDAQTAVTYYEESIEISPMPLAYNGLGHVLSNGINDQIRAIESLEQAIELDPSYVSPYHNLALAHARLGEKEKALEYYEGVYELTGENDTRRDELREELLAIDTINIQDDELAQ